MDNFMLSNKTMKTKSTELTNLKSIRDQLLLQGVQLAGMLQDKPLCSLLMGYALSSQSALNVIVLGKEQLNLKNQNNLNAFMSQEKLGNFKGSKEIEFGSNAQLGKIIQSQQLSLVNSKQDLGNMVGSIMVYDKANLSFLLGNKTELQRVLSSSQITALLQGSAALGNLAGVAIFSSQGLNLYQANIDLKSVYISQQSDLGMVLSSTQLNQILSNQQGLNVVYSSDFISMMGQLGNMGLGVISPEVQ
jgi:hypothetical protein